MKPELAVLPMDVWADVFVFNNRQQLAQIVDRFKERAFAEKLQKFLHDPKCGKHSLRFLEISRMLKECKYELRKRKIPEYQAYLDVSENPYLVTGRPIYTECEFTEHEMPENINSFKKLTIIYLDDKVLDFLNKLKPLLTNVFLGIYAIESTEHARILLTHLLPMLASIRGISCTYNNGWEFLERHFADALARARELHLSAKPASIPAYLSWLNAPQDFDLHGPRFLNLSANFDTIIAIVDAVRKSQRRATLATISRDTNGLSLYKDCEFPEDEMPENINNFKQLTIKHFDDQVLSFLNKIKPLFTQVLLDIESTQSAKNVRILLGHLLPIIGGIRGIQCKHGCLEFFKEHFPGTLERAKELSLSDDENATKASIPAYLDWLTAPQDFDAHGPRFLNMSARPNTIGAMVDAVRKQFLDATAPSAAFVIFLELCVEWRQRDYRAEELTIQNAATKEQLVVRNASFITKYRIPVRYVEIQRYPVGAEANMREWIKNKKKYKSIQYHDEAVPEQMISIDGYSLTVGQIKKAGKQDNDQPANDDKDEAGPSSSAPAAKETCACVIS